MLRGRAGVRRGVGIGSAVRPVLAGESPSAADDGGVARLAPPLTLAGESPSAADDGGVTRLAPPTEVRACMSDRRCGAYLYAAKPEAGPLRLATQTRSFWNGYISTGTASTPYASMVW